MNSAPAPKTPSPAATLGQRITVVAHDLSEAFESLLAAMPGRPQQSRPLARMLSVDKSISHRLVTAIRKADPLATVHLIPGPEPLRRVVASARKLNVPADITKRVEAAIDAFETLIVEESQDRSGLDAIISTWLPSARERFEKNAKQAMFRGARQLRGLACDVFQVTAITHPAEDHEGCNTALIVGYYGLRRIRPEAQLGFGGRIIVTHPNSWIGSIDKVPTEEPEGFLWRKYCSPKDIELSIHHIPGSDSRTYELKWHDEVGPRSARDVVLRYYAYRSLRRVREANDPKTKAGISECVGVPAKKMIFDVIMHTDLYPGCHPEIRVMLPGSRGSVNANDRTRDFDELPLVERFESLGVGVERFRAEEIPAYITMLSEVCSTLKWDPEKLRCFRGRIDYPPFGTEIHCIVNLPVARP